MGREEWCEEGGVVWGGRSGGEGGRREEGGYMCGKEMSLMNTWKKRERLDEYCLYLCVIQSLYPHTHHWPYIHV